MIDPRASGRSIVVRPGQSPPPPWEVCERVEVGAVTPLLADALGQAWRSRQPLVISLVPGLGLDDPEHPPAESVSGLQPWELSVMHDFVGERLHHGVWANSIDGRGADLRYRWSNDALALGAVPGGAADLVVVGDTEVLCDGGPIDIGLASRVGKPVLHRISIEHGVLEPLGDNRTDAELAPDQLAAVLHPGGGARVIAPAGSGKTRVLTERARLLLTAWRLPSNAIAVVAFNRRAAEELKSRTADLRGLRVRTLNALGLRLLPPGIRTIEEAAVRELLSTLVEVPRKVETDPIAPWLEALGRVRLGLQHPEDVIGDLPDVIGLEDVSVRYRDLLSERNEADFDEQVIGAIDRLMADAAFRHRTQRFARLLLVDEFQDLTPAHMLLFRLLSGPAGEVFGVGDDDQTIYGYAGATPEWLVRFNDYFPGSFLHALEVNYRCPTEVVSAASNLLSRNALRVDKKIRPRPSAVDDRSALRVVAGDEPAALRTAARVVELLETAPPTDVAVLSRVNASLAPVQVVLRHHGIATNGGVDRRFLTRAAVGAALAWLSVGTARDGAFRSADLRHAARRPKRGMRHSLLDLIARQRSVGEVDRLINWLESKASDRDALKAGEFLADLVAVRKVAGEGSTIDLIDEIRYRVGSDGLEQSASSLDGWSHGTVASHRDDLDALMVLGHLQPDPARFGAWLADALSVPNDPAGVTLASIHAVKGREWEHVIVHDVTAGLMPHRLVDGIEEERRIFHVGLTRGISSVTLVPGKPLSPFLAEMNEPGSPVPKPAPTRLVPSRLVKKASPDPAAAVDPVEAQEGLCFDHGGYLHEVVDLDPGGAITRVGDEGARLTVEFGTVVRVLGVPRQLAHPNHVMAFERFRAWRTQRANGKPAYTVLSDETLRALAMGLPADEASLARVKGIGPMKLEAFGEELLELMAEMRSPSSG
ncbi:MAG TPA: ATP-dependent DNA helicase UvrD2 [Acidimicrobiia bacterium]|nr:ATP-dependent DNA helicase UvrD2 [Acidimicrobiia bacterium]